MDTRDTRDTRISTNSKAGYTAALSQSGSRMTIRHHAITVAALAAAAMAAAPRVALSQQPFAQAAQAARATQFQRVAPPNALDVRWQPWVGCWQPVVMQPTGLMSAAPVRDTQAPLVCVVPGSSPSAVSITTIVAGKVVTRRTIDATGQSYTSAEAGCNVAGNAVWSADGSRLFLKSESTCPHNVRRSSSAIFAFAPDGDWLDVQGLSEHGNAAVRTARYRDAGTPANLPADIASALRAAPLAAPLAAQSAAPANPAATPTDGTVTSADVVEASHKLDARVVEAWLVELGQKFSLDAAHLVALADAGVPGNVTDAMVALSYPKAFALDRSAGDRAALGERAYGYPSNGRDLQVWTEPSYGSPYDYSPYGLSVGGLSPYGYSPYGYSRYGGYNSPYSAYGQAYGSGYWNRPPAVIVLRGGQSGTSSNHVVKGRGYTQSDPATGGSTAQPRTSNSTAAGQSTGSNSSARTGSGRTAKPRP